MIAIMRGIARKKEVPEHTDELHFGRNWFVAMSRRIHDVSIVVDKQSSEEDKQKALMQIKELLLEKQRTFLTIKGKR